MKKVLHKEIPKKKENGAGLLDLSSRLVHSGGWCDSDVAPIGSNQQHRPHLVPIQPRRSRTHATRPHCPVGPSLTRSVGPLRSRLLACLLCQPHSHPCRAPVYSSPGPTTSSSPPWPPPPLSSSPSCRRRSSSARPALPPRPRSTSSPASPDSTAPSPPATTPGNNNNLPFFDHRLV